MELAAPAPERLDGTALTWSNAGLFLAGGATAFVAHETCHVLAGLALGNVPTVQPVKFLGVIPFFAISPGITCVGNACYKANGTPFPPGPRGLYFIVSAGILCQEAEDEVILSLEPGIRYQDAAFLKGMLAFNTLASVGYALANLFNLEPPEGDLRAMSRLVPVPHAVLSGLVLATAALDISRYYFPDAEWLPWVSRVTKLATVGVIFAF
ncbi:MAG TPA: hypothetical protein VMK42_18695 [Anaeromyxobacteraceae bacterium]|nr:hypothetical protein [Anaeromyxobacteraceae bacterium]